MLKINWATFHRDFPITFGLLGLNVILFLLAKVGVIPPLVSLPGILNLGTFGAHFFHADLIHLASNALILVLVGRVLEPNLGWQLLPVTIGIWLGTILILWFMNNHPLLGFSGIAMGLLTFAMCLYRNNPGLYQLLWPLVVINILFGLMPGISWWGHLGGAIAGGLVFYLYKILKPQNL